MKYLFAAIDARQARAHPATSRSAQRLKHNANELKQLLLDASEGVDEKTSTHDFVDTLERIVNEIKNTNEHSGAFLQKVKKSEVPDYYDFIKRPMDLATLMKRVKSQMYRTKKAFADDLDLIWSNCLLYNSHPTHPLRRSAEILRQKSNQLLEFISDPSIPKGSLYTSHSNSQHKGKNGTPAFDADEDGDAEGESEEDDHHGAGLTRNGSSARFGMPGVRDKLMNGVNGDSHFDSASSPNGSRAGTPLGPKRAGRGPLGRNQTRSPSPPPTLSFQERPAIIRTASNMFLHNSLDSTLSELELNLSSATSIHQPSSSSSSFFPIASTSSSLGLIEPTTFLPLTPIDPPPASAIINGEEPLPSTNGATPTQTQTPISRPSTPRPAPLPPPPPLAIPTLPTTLSTLLSTISPPLPPTASEAPPESLWWQTSVLPQLLAAGIPNCPFPSSSSALSSSVSPKVESEGKVQVKVKAKGKKLNGNLKGKGKEVGLGKRMGKNLKELNEIKKLHKAIGRAKHQDTSLLPSSDEDEISSQDGSTKGKGGLVNSFVDTGVPPEAFEGPTAPQAGIDSMKVISSRVLGHTGFDGASAMAVGVLAHVAAEYLVNFGRAIRFYSDRYGYKMSTEQILLHALTENGVPGPADLASYVTNDIDQYGTKLTKLRTRLQQARMDQLASLEVPGVTGEEIFDHDDEDTYVLGGLNRPLGEDFFCLKEVVGLETVSVPSRLLRGNSEGPDDSGLKYPPAPRHIPLTSSAVDLQIGLLRPVFRLRETTDARLIDDWSLPARSKLPRNKVPPSGKIPIKGKRKGEEAVGGGGVGGGGGKNKRKKTIDVTLEIEG